MTFLNISPFDNCQIYTVTSIYSEQSIWRYRCIYTMDLLKRYRYQYFLGLYLEKRLIEWNTNSLTSVQYIFRFLFFAEQSHSQLFSVVIYRFVFRVFLEISFFLSSILVQRIVFYGCWERNKMNFSIDKFLCVCCGSSFYFCYLITCFISQIMTEMVKVFFSMSDSVL